MEGERLCEGWTSVAMAARYWITFFVFSVLPAPDSPLTIKRKGVSSFNYM